jgi:plastocyanin
VYAIIVGEPFLFIRVPIALVLAALAWRFDRWWAVAPAIVGGVAIVAETIAFVIDSLDRFDTVEFGFGWLNIVLGIGVIIAALADLVARRRGTAQQPAPGAAVQLATAGAAAMIALAVVSGIVTVASRDTVSDAEREGALVVTYKDIEINEDEDELTVGAGQPVRLVIDNKDIAFHDFELDAADVYVELSARESKLVEFTIAEPGAYEFRCTVTGHDKMKGTLTVE